MIKMQEILDLSVADRITVVEQIWDSIDTAEIELSNELTEELDRRLDRYEKGETNFVRWAEVKRELNSER